MTPPDDRPPEDGIDAFLGDATRELDDWHWLWSGDHPFPVETHRGLLGRLVVAFKRLLRPVVKPPLNDLWDRQRVFNMVVVEHLMRGETVQTQIGDELAVLRGEIAKVGVAVEKLEGYRVEGVGDMVRHSDALFSLLDQKLDRYRRESAELRRTLEAAASGEKPLR